MVIYYTFPYFYNTGTLTQPLALQEHHNSNNSDKSKVKVFLLSALLPEIQCDIMLLHKTMKPWMIRLSSTIRALLYRELKSTFNSL